MREIEAKLSEIPYIDKLMEINGIGLKTVSCFIAEVGDIGRFDNPTQLQKLAGYAIVADSSGKHNGESRISHRGRKRLRYALYEAAISVIGKNKEFREIHDYYRTRKQNPLKKMQSVIAIACKLIWSFFTLLTKGGVYDGQKMLSVIVCPETIMAALKYQEAVYRGWFEHLSKECLNAETSHGSWKYKNRNAIGKRPLKVLLQEGRKSVIKHTKNEPVVGRNIFQRA